MNNDKVLGCIGILLWSAGITIVSALLSGWVLSVMWKWFIVPLFQVPILTWANALGLSSMMSLLLSDLKREDFSTNDDKSTITDRIVKATLIAIFRPLFALGFGWIIYQFV